MGEFAYLKRQVATFPRQREALVRLLETTPDPLGALEAVVGAGRRRGPADGTSP
ncbi:MAG: hypothetical protein L0214_08620 [candidate division NC10 bacterium]|nr:hypothetical protein [candidate division NC10 bacterium]